MKCFMCVFNRHENCVLKSNGKKPIKSMFDECNCPECLINQNRTPLQWKRILRMYAMSAKTKNTNSLKSASTAHILNRYPPFYCPVCKVRLDALLIRKTFIIEWQCLKCLMPFTADTIFRNRSEFEIPSRNPLPWRK